MNKKPRLSKKSTALSFISIGGVVLSIIFAIKNTPKAMKAIEQKEQELDRELSTTEKIVEAAPHYIPTITSGVVTITSIAVGNHITKKEQAAMYGSLVLANKALTRYKKNVKEALQDKETVIAIEDRVAQEMYDEQEVPPISDKMRKKKELYYDAFSQRFFWSTPDHILEAMYHFNRNFAIGQFRSISEFYEFIPELYGKGNNKWDNYIYIADQFWEDGLSPWIDFSFRKKKLKDGTEYTVIYLDWEPLDRDIEAVRELYG